MSVTGGGRSASRESTVVNRLRAAGSVFAEDEARLLIAAARTPEALSAMVDRRIAGLPLEHVLGWAEFCGLRIAVDEGVFVPRHRTELLARLSMELVGAGAVVVDLCCGSGALGAVISQAAGGIALHASDIDPAAVRCARRNLAQRGGHVHIGDLYKALPAALHGRVDLIVANVPYVPTAEIDNLPREARLYEASIALDGGADGLDVVRRVTAGSPAWLTPGGHLLVEVAERQAPRALEVFASSGLAAHVERDQDLDATVIVGTLAT